jgi:hypothetical protein
MQNKVKQLYWQPLAVTMAMSFLAVLDWPYGYYQFLRLMVTGSAIYYAYIAHSLSKSGWMWIFIISALLFNPFIPVRLSREIWTPINIILPIIWIISFKKLK